MAMYHQYRDLPQIPSISDDARYGQWSNQTAYRHPRFHAEEDFTYNGLNNNDVMDMQPMGRFLVEPSPLSPGLLSAKFHRTIPHQLQRYSQYEQWPTPEPRYVSPDRTSISGNSSYATQNEVRSPYHSDHFGSPEDLTQATVMYTSGDHMKPLYLPEPPSSGGSISLRDLEYVPEPEAGPVDEDIEIVDTPTDVAVKSDSVHINIDAPVEEYKHYSEPRAEHSLRDGESVQPMSPEEESSDTEYTPSRSSRRRRSSASNSGSNKQSYRRQSHHNKKNPLSTSASRRVSKRSNRVTASSTNTGKAYTDPQYNGGGQKYFPCPLSMYGCQSNFSSKNEWKRHVSTQHIKLGFWRCDLCATTNDPHDDQTVYHNDFNRKDLFTQHLRRMHAAPNQMIRNLKEYPVNEDNITVHQLRCFKILRATPPQSQCLFCPEEFHGPASWKDRMEHIGRHLEKDRKADTQLGDVASWNQDKLLEEWLCNEGIIALDKSGQWSIGDGRPRRQIANGEEQPGEDN